MAGQVKGTWASDHLNLIRAIAALAVLVYHVRYRFFVDYSEVTNPDALTVGFYALTSFGHDAVIVFFVLSGYFISSTVLRDQHSGKWSWSKYLVNRATRLYVVLLPAILLTLLWDSLGLCYFADNPIYTGAPQSWSADFFPVQDRLSATTLGGNLAFLQSFYVRPLGSNDPLWSLSFEFWYYLLFPCAWLALLAPISHVKRAFLLLIGGALAAGLGITFLIYFPIWLLGTVVYLAPNLPELGRTRQRCLLLVSLVIFLAMLLVSHSSTFKALVGHSVIAADYVTALCFAALLYVIRQDRAPSPQGRYARAADVSAAFSYTLYAVHMPLLVFCRAALIAGAPWQPTASMIAVGGLLGIVATAYAFAVSRLTEANTNRIRDWVLALLEQYIPRRADVPEAAMPPPAWATVTAQAPILPPR